MYGPITCHRVARSPHGVVWDMAWDATDDGESIHHIGKLQY